MSSPVISVICMSIYCWLSNGKDATQENRVVILRLRINHRRRGEKPKEGKYPPPSARGSDLMSPGVR